jgi:putative oxidoreductase
MIRFIQIWSNFGRHLELLGGYIPQLGLRLLLAYEFWVAGVEKYRGTNWFADIQSGFPFPFNYVPAEISWQLATWFELIGPIALLLGIATRFFSLSLLVLTIVAWMAVHAGSGYNVCDNGYKLPLIYLLMFLPLIFNGAGKASLDYFVWQRVVKAGTHQSA